MVRIDTKSEIANTKPAITSHSCCAQKSCVEVLLDGDMQLVYVSEQYNPVEQTPVVNTKKPEVTFGTIQSMPKDVVGPKTAWDNVIVKDQMPANQEMQRLNSNFPDPNCAEKKRKMEELAAASKSSSGCSSCAEKDKQKKAGMLKRLAKGVPGLLKSELGIDQASAEVVDKRKSICLDCPEGIYNFGVCDEELGGCGCFLASKVTIEGESCPKGHW